MGFGLRRFIKKATPIAFATAQRVSESGVLARAGISGKISGLPFARKWIQSNGPQPSRFDPGAAHARLGDKYLKSFWATVRGRR